MFYFGFFLKVIKVDLLLVRSSERKSSYYYYTKWWRNGPNILILVVHVQEL